MKNNIKYSNLPKYLLKKCFYSLLPVWEKSMMVCLQEASRDP